MSLTYQQPLWGYEIDLPPGWNHQRFSGRDGFAADPEAFESGYMGDTLAQLLMQGEWNSLHKPADQLWNRHLGRTTTLLGAKKISTAPWEMAGAAGFEAEIVLPQKTRKRIWAGLLEKGELVLTFLVLHWKENRETMEPLLSEIISSLRLIHSAEGINHTPEGLPLPPGAQAVSPDQIIDDIQNPALWSAYQGPFPPGSLQAFYLRELPHSSWRVKEYIPFPNQIDIPFARIQLTKGREQLTLGLLPGSGEELEVRIAIKR